MPMQTPMPTLTQKQMGTRVLEPVVRRVEMSHPELARPSRMAGAVLRLELNMGKRWLGWR